MQEIKLAFAAAEAKFICLTSALLILNLYLQFKKWQLLVRLEKNVSAGQILSSLLAGFTLGFITPGRVGEFGRGFFIKDCSWQSILGLTIIDKLVSLIVMYFAGLVGLSYFLQLHLHYYVWVPAVLTGILLIMIVLFFLLRPEMLHSVLRRFASLGAPHAKFRQFASCMDRLTALLTLKVLSLAIFHFITFTLQFYLLVRAFSPLSPWQGFVAISSIMIVKTILPVSIGDLGVRESAAIYFLGYFNVPSVAALNASLSIFLINVFIPSMAGLVIILIDRFNGIGRWSKSRSWGKNTIILKSKKDDLG